MISLQLTEMQHLRLTNWIVSAEGQQRVLRLCLQHRGKKILRIGMVVAETEIPPTPDANRRES